MILLRLCLFGLVAFGASPACRAVKAKPNGSTAFLQTSPGLLRDRPNEGAFHEVWRNTDRRVIASALAKPAIAVLPVNVALLKPTGNTVAKFEENRMGIARPVQALAAYTQTEFARAVSRFGPVQRGNHLVLELALTEFTPTSPVGNAAKTAAGFVIGPASALASRWVKGTIAIEGRLRDPATNAIVWQFADRESDPIALVSVKKFQRKGFAELIIRQWAQQFATAVRTPAGTKLPDSSPLRINPF
jgi:hypothetical protein